MKKFWSDYKFGANEVVTYNYTPSLVAKSTFFYMQSIGYYRCDEKYLTRREGYRSFLLIYTISGKGCARYRGRQYELRAGQVLLMDCYDYQEYYSAKGEMWEIKWIHFYGSSSNDYFNLIYNKFGPVINMADSDLLLHYLDDAMKLVKDNDFQLEIKMSRLIMSMLSEILLAESQKSEEYDIKLPNAQVQAAFDFVDKNYERNISLRDMASAACMSTFHFARIFKKVTGYSPYEYLVKYRINKAKGLLNNTDNPIEVVSDSIGFCSTSNFIKTFRELEGMTPLKYRKYWKG